MKRQITNATAIYTGGGIYLYYGQLSDGNWFRACDNWEWIEICDSDTSVEEAEYNEFYEEHSIETLIDDEYESFWNEMLQWIIDNEPKGNYQAYELEERLIKRKVNMELTTVTELIEKLKELSPKAKVFVGGTHGYLHIVEDEDGNAAISFEDRKEINFLGGRLI